MDSNYMPLSTFTKLRVTVDAVSQAASDPEFVPYTAEEVGRMAAETFRGSGYESRMVTPRIIGKLIGVLVGITTAGRADRNETVCQLDDIARDYMQLANDAEWELGNPQPFPGWLVEGAYAGAYGVTGGQWVAVSTYTRSQVEDSAADELQEWSAS